MLESALNSFHRWPDASFFLRRQDERAAMEYLNKVEHHNHVQKTLPSKAKCHQHGGTGKHNEVAPRLYVIERFDLRRLLNQTSAS